MIWLDTALTVGFWLCLATVGYAYVGYPLIVWVLSRCFGERRRALADAQDDLPSVSLLIAAYNEEAVIEERIQTALKTAYPADKLEIVIASDGSSDATPEIVRRFAGRGVRLLDYPERRGKATVLNSAFTEVTGEIVVLSDANTHTEPEAMRRIVRRFREPQVGVVCGRLILTDPQTGRNADSLYWRYETFLKECEGRLGALLGANGGIYAIRRTLYQPIPNGTIVDDFTIPLLAKLRTGCDLVYETEAIAREETPADVRAEFHRRARIGAGGFQSLKLLWPLLHPRHGWTAFTFLSHKVVRWLCPFLLIGMLVTNALLWEHALYRYLLFGQLGFYALALLAGLLPGHVKALKPLRLTTMFVSMNAALFVGFCRWLRGSQKGAWKRTSRVAEMEGAAH